MKLSALPAAVRAVASMLEEANLHMKQWDVDDACGRPALTARGYRETEELI